MIIVDLKRILEKKRVSLTELSEKTGISRTSLSQLANGKTQGIQFDTLEKICLALEIKPSVLFKIESEPLDVKFDFSAINEHQTNIISIYLVFKSEMKKETFWDSYAIHFNFEDDENDVIFCSLNRVKEEITRDLVYKKYKTDKIKTPRMDWYNHTSDYETPLNKSVTKGFDNILKRDGLHYFTQNIDLINMGLEYINTKKYRNKKYIKMSQNYTMKFLKEDDLKILNLNKDNSDSPSTIYVEYYYDLEQKKNKYTICKNKKPRIEVFTDIYKDYTKKISLL